MSLISSDTYYVIVGLGLTGQSVARYYYQLGRRFHVFDTRPSPPDLNVFAEQFPDVRIYLESIPEDILLGASEIILSPGVPRDESHIAKAIEDKVPVINDITLFLRELDERKANAEKESIKVIGITGSNGKTTVTSMLGLAGKAAGINVAVGGNIGTPALDLLFENSLLENSQFEKEVELYVLELSSFQLETLGQANLDVACVLNLSADHMDRYASLAQYSMAKQRIYFGAKHVVYNLDDPLTVPPVVEHTQRYGFGIKKPREEYEKQYVYDPDDRSMCYQGQVIANGADLKTKGMHNLSNACALLALCDAASISQDAAVDALQRFTGLPHRCEWLAEKQGVTFINDSKATNVGATQAAIMGLASSSIEIVLIAGGDGKDADFTPLSKVIDGRVKSVILLGRDAKKIGDAINQTEKCFYVRSLEEAVMLAYEQAKSGDLVLLSPACASLDMFNSYVERGENFKQAVARLPS